MLIEIPEPGEDLRELSMADVRLDDAVNGKATLHGITTKYQWISSNTIPKE